VGLLRRREPAPSIDLLVAGLGNPGAEYARTRHNLGFMVADRLVEELGGSWRSKFSGRIATARDGDVRLAFFEPQTFMNVSGPPVAAAARFYGVDPEAILVVHDEIDLELGDVRAKMGGGLAGHNGLRSVRSALGTADFPRVRIGIGRPGRGDRRPVADWVLQPFEPGTDVDALVERGAACTLLVAREGIDAAMRAFNGAGPAPPSGDGG
jgi:peptidyl-tRNA hydrolase, PTH1 family